MTEKSEPISGGISETVLKLRGLPWSVEVNDVLNFFKDCEVVGGTDGIKLMLGREGRPTGEAYVEFETAEDAKRAMLKNKEFLGNRYIEVFSVKNSELDWLLKREGYACPTERNKDSVLRLRGLPYGCSKEEISQFFTGLAIVPNGILIALDEMGRTSGTAYVQFATPEISDQALLKHKEKINHRYIEIFRSSMQEALQCLNSLLCDMGNFNRPRPYERMFPRFPSPMVGAMTRRNTGFRGGFRGIRQGGWSHNSLNTNYHSGYNNRGNMSMFSGRNRGLSDRMPIRRGRLPGSQHVSSTGHSVHMRGLPYTANENDVNEFFYPLNPCLIEFDFSSNGRPSGEVDVDFETHEEAVEAMKMDKRAMGERYVELFLHSSAVLPSHRQLGASGDIDNSGRSIFNM